jgi:hypothetical protein
VVAIIVVYALSPEPGIYSGRKCSLESIDELAFCEIDEFFMLKPLCCQIGYAASVDSYI